MLLAVLIVLNIPVFLPVGWPTFDTDHGFADTLESYQSIQGPCSRGEPM